MYKYTLINRLMTRLKILGIIGLAFFTACGNGTSTAKAPKSKAIPIHVASVEIQEIPLFIESIGSLKPLVSIEIRPQVSGKLQAIQFKEGARVEKHQPLFLIDSNPYQIKLQETKAQLAQDVATLQASKKKLDRYQSLASKDLIPQQEWDELVAAVAVKEAQISASGARVQSAQLDLDNCQISSPIEGRIGKVTLDTDNLVVASVTPLARLFSIDQLLVKFNLSESDYLLLSKQKKSYPIKVISLIDPDLSAEGEIHFMDHNFHPESGLLHVEGKISNPSLKFLPGQSARVLISLSNIADAKVIPQKSVRINQKGSYVYLINENKAEIRQITVGEEMQDKVRVLEGLEVGDKVVTDGHLRLSEGAEVEIKNPDKE